MKPQNSYNIKIKNFEMSEGYDLDAKDIINRMDFASSVMKQALETIRHRDFYVSMEIYHILEDNESKKKLVKFMISKTNPNAIQKMELDELVIKYDLKEYQKTVETARSADE